jgi:mannose-6-phosphate isomerase-like protein (cupin superfamily)
MEEAMNKGEVNTTGGSVPTHHGRFPFPPEEKRPALLTREMNMPRTYGKGDGIHPTRTCASTDKIHVSEFLVLPGKRFDPPDIHVGDEVYYCEQGVGHVFNPETGEVHIAQPGDFVLIPAGTWHQVWNFGDVAVKFVNWIAPMLWSETSRGTDIKFEGDPKYFKASREE